MRTSVIRAALAVGLAFAFLSGRPPVRGADWPQWRGPDRTNVSAETGLLKRWPEKGPALAWQAGGLGEGACSVAVARGRLYTLGYRGDDEVVTALDEHTGKKVWARRIGPAVNESPVMRWLSQRTPTVDGDRLYAARAKGELVCLRTADGREVWRTSYTADLGGQSGVWWYCDRPLVDGDRLICTPGGARATVAALDKRTGRVLWRCPVPGGDRAGYSTTLRVDLRGRRQYVAFLSGGLVGVSADGKLLWRYSRVSNRIANAHSPAVRGDLLFCATAYGGGVALLQLIPDKDGCHVREVYYRREVLPLWHDSTVLVGEHVYVGTQRDLACLELATGRPVWREPGADLGTVSLTCADGHLYLRSQRGTVRLVEASPKGYRLKGVLPIPGAVPKPGATAPVVAGGRLYLRDDDRLWCYEVAERAAGGAPKRPDADAGQRPGPAKGIRKKWGQDSCFRSPVPISSGRSKGRSSPDVFVPTPQDVVERMLGLAGVKRDSVVYDLGCGDGRIVVTAARKYGCKAVGVDIDSECVRMARARVKDAGVGDLVTVRQEDLFKLDLRGADVITLYLLPRTLERLVPRLMKLRPGVRIVGHAFEIPGVRPDRVETYTSREDALPHKVYVWTTPLKRPSQARGRD
jgi:outer membrane protein assembly factor BamB